MTWIRLKWLRLNAVSQEKLILYALNSNYSNYLPQTKFAKVMFLQVSVCPQGVWHVWQGGMRGGGHA